jgi:cell division protein ZapA
VPHRLDRRRDRAAGGSREQAAGLIMAEGGKTVEVSLLGRTYRVACEDNEREALMQAVAYLDAKMNEIRKAGKVMGAERIAVMAALNVAHELLSVKLGGGFDMGKVKRRISTIESRLDAAIAKQEKLF